MADRPSKYASRPDIVERDKLIWRTWLVQRALGYVPVACINTHVASILGISRYTVHNVVYMTRPEGCYE